MKSNHTPSVTFVSPNRVRAKSHSESKVPNSGKVSSETKRHHSSSVSSVSSQMSDDFEPYTTRHKSKLEDIDLEKQIMISAGGNNASVCCFLLKILLLTTVVLGCGVLVFYAL